MTRSTFLVPCQGLTRSPDLVLIGFQDSGDIHGAPACSDSREWLGARLVLGSCWPTGALGRNDSLKATGALCLRRSHSSIGALSLV